MNRFVVTATTAVVGFGFATSMLGGCAKAEAGGPVKPSTGLADTTATSTPLASKTVGASPATSGDLANPEPGNDAKPSTASHDATASWKTLESKTGGVSLKVPEDWVPADPEDPGYVALQKAIGKANPQLQQLVSTGKQLLIVGLCADPKKCATGFCDNVNINEMAGGGKTDWTDDDASEAKKALEGILPHEGALRIERLSVPEGPTLRYAVRMKVNTPAHKTLFTHTVGYMVLHGGSIYVVTYTSAPERAEKMDALASQSIKTLKVG